MKEERQKRICAQTELNQSNPQTFYLPSDQSIKGNILMTSVATVKFPYYFEESERRQWIKKQQQQKSKNMNISQSLYSYIVVYQVKNFKQLSKPNAHYTWIINKKTMEVQFQAQKYIPKPKLGQICEQLQKKNLSKQPGNKNLKIQNLVFFGRCQTQHKSIMIQDKKLSNKHMVLKKNQNAAVKEQKNSLYSFLLCLKRLKMKQPSEERCGIEKLSGNLIKTIISFLLISNENTYSLIDNSSKNGSSQHLLQYNLTKCQNKIKVSKALESLSLRVSGILAKSKLSIQSLTMRIDQQIAGIFLKNIDIKNGNKQTKIFNRNLHLENSQQTIQTLILNIQTPKVFKIFILYSQEETYNILKPEYDLNIEKCKNLADQKEEKQKFIGTIEFNQNWYLKPAKIDDFSEQLVPQKEYTIKNKSFIKLSETTKLIIDVNILS